MNKKWFYRCNRITGLAYFVGALFFFMGAFLLYIFSTQEREFIILAPGVVLLLLGGYLLFQTYLWNNYCYRTLGNIYTELACRDRQAFEREALQLNRLAKRGSVAFFPGELGLWMGISPLPILMVPFLLPYDRIGWAYVWQRHGMIPLVTGNEVVSTIGVPGNDSIYIHDTAGKRYIFHFTSRTASSKRLLVELQTYAPNAVYGYSKDRARRAKRNFQAFLEEERISHS